MIKSVFSLVCGVIIVGCARPTAPESLNPGSGGYSIVAELAVPGFAQDVILDDTLAYIAQGEGGLAIVSIADPAHPRILSVCFSGVRGYSYKLARKDSIVYIAAGAFGINTINVANPYAPAHIIFTGGSGISTTDVSIFGTWLLEARGEAGVRFADIAETEPGHIDTRGTIISPGYARATTTTADSTLLVACGEMGLAMYDIKDIGTYGGGPGFYDERKRYVDWIDLPGYAVHVRPMEDRRIAFVACGTAGVQVVDFSDTTLRVIGGYPTGGYAKEVAYSRGRLYVTTEARGLQIFSVADPAAPALLGVVETKYALGVDVNDSYVFIADQTEGLIVIKIPPY